MISELDVYRAAKKLLEEHCKQATLIAADRAAKLRHILAECPLCGVKQK